MKIDNYLNFISKYETFDVNEGLIQSVDPSTFEYHLRKMFLAKNISYNINYLPNGNIFVDFYNINKQDLIFYFRIIGNLGYYVSEYSYNNNNKKFENDDIDFLFHNKNEIDITIFVESYYDMEVKNINILYHTTPEIYVEKIMENGLSPKSKNKISSHPPRIFLCKTLNPTISLARKFKGMSNYNCTWNILEIDCNKIKDFKCYEDPNYRLQGGVYTLNYISPEFIKNLNYSI